MTQSSLRSHFKLVSSKYKITIYATTANINNPDNIPESASEEEVIEINPEPIPPILPLQQTLYPTPVPTQSSIPVEPAQPIEPTSSESQPEQTSSTGDYNKLSEPSQPGNTESNDSNTCYWCSCSHRIHISYYLVVH